MIRVVLKITGAFGIGLTRILAQLTSDGDGNRSLYSAGRPHLSISLMGKCGRYGALSKCDSLIALVDIRGCSKL